MENRKYNKIIPIVIIVIFSLFSVFAFSRLDMKKTEKREKEERQLAMQLEKEKEEAALEEKLESLKATPTPIDDLVKEENSNQIKIENITNYPINQLAFKLNGVDSPIPFTVESMLSFGYLFKDKIANDGQNSYKYNQLNELIKANSYSEFMETLSPGQQIVSILAKNTSDEDKPLMQCDVYGISASTCEYKGIKDMKEPTFECNNGVHLGMKEGELIKIMGKYDAKFYLDDEKKIARYQWYQSIDNINITHIMTCDVKNGIVSMLSIEF